MGYELGQMPQALNVQQVGRANWWRHNLLANEVVSRLHSYRQMVTSGCTNNECGLDTPTKAYDLNLLALQGMIGMSNGYKSRNRWG